MLEFEYTACDNLTITTSLYPYKFNLHSSLTLFGFLCIVVTTHTDCCNVRTLTGFPREHIYISYASQNTNSLYPYTTMTDLSVYVLCRYT
jgi:hypothetical protein